jgi:hypothetical protein
VSYGIEENKRKEILTFKVVSFDIRYNCILERHFILKFMAVIHTADVTIKMPGPKGVIVPKSDQCDALACANATLTHAGWFGEKEAQELVAKVAKAHGGSTRSEQQLPNHQPPAHSGHQQRRRTHSWALHQTNPSPISWWMTRRRGPLTRK